MALGNVQWMTARQLQVALIIATRSKNKSEIRKIKEECKRRGIKP